MSLSQTLCLKMGNKLIFKEPLQALKSLSNPNTRGQQSNYIPTGNKRKRNYEGMDIIPKFIANENMKEINLELLNRLCSKKNTFNKMVNAYFSGYDENFFNSINEIEMEMNRVKDISENLKTKDFDGFRDLLSTINNNNTNANLTAMQNISLDEYMNLDFNKKKAVLGGIYQNKAVITQRLNLKPINNINKNQRRANSMYINKPQTNIPKNNDGRMSNANIVSSEQLELFKIFIGNPKLPNKHAQSYFDRSNPKVKVAADNYFKNIYGVDFLTLYYYYPMKANSGVKIHKFKFTADVLDLFMAAEDDFISVKTPRLYTENGTEIINDKKTKCIGVLNLANNSKIKVLG